jgi:hypothetical protein
MQLLSSTPSLVVMCHPHLNSNLHTMGPVHAVIMGYVQGLEGMTIESGEWMGDIVGNVVRVLQKVNRANCMIYVEVAVLKTTYQIGCWQLGVVV